MWDPFRAFPRANVSAAQRAPAAATTYTLETIPEHETRYNISRVTLIYHPANVVWNCWKRIFPLFFYFSPPVLFFYGTTFSSLTHAHTRARARILFSARQRCVTTHELASHRKNGTATRIIITIIIVLKNNVTRAHNGTRNTPLIGDDPSTSPGACRVRSVCRSRPPPRSASSDGDVHYLCTVAGPSATRVLFRSGFALFYLFIFRFPCTIRKCALAVVPIEPALISSVRRYYCNTTIIILL